MDASHFESEYILGRKLAFYCTAQGSPRPHVTWLKDGIRQNRLDGSLDYNSKEF